MVSDGSSDHPGFSKRSAQSIHVDGLLDEIGTIPVSMLYCVRPAATGGRTILFNSVAAYHDFSTTDPAAAKVLCYPKVLRRYSTIPGVTAHRDGPVFQHLDDGTIGNRYADGPTEQTNTGFLCRSSRVNVSLPQRSCLTRAGKLCGWWGRSATSRACSLRQGAGVTVSIGRD